MKIAICSHDYPNDISGPNVWLDRMTTELLKKNIEPVILFTRGGIGDEYRYITKIKKKIENTYIYKGLSYTEHKIEWILSVLNEVKPDIFIPNYDIPGLYASRWVNEAGIPTIGVMHSDHKSYMAILDEFVSKPGPYQLSAMVCVSKLLEQKALIKKQNTEIRRIPCGTPIPDLQASKNTSLNIVYAGKITEKAKRISEVTSVLCRTVKEIPETTASLFGSGDSIDNVEKIIKKNGLDIPVKYRGVLDNALLQSKLIDYQVSVLLSDYEGLPISLMETMACGLVPVCLNIDSGIPELVEHNETGMLVEDRGDDFVKAIKRLKYEEGLWERLSKNAREKIVSEYSTKNAVIKWIELFDKLLGKKSTAKKQIEIPSKLNLPDIHPDLIKSERRWPGHISYNFRKSVGYSRGIAGKGKKIFMSLLKADEN